MNRVTQTALTLIIATIGGFAQASESKIIVSGDTIFISGYIGSDTKKIFSEAPASAKNVDISSAGGLVSAAEYISDIIHERHMTTIVRGYCYSACTIIFASGAQRIAHAESSFSIHGVSIGGRGNAQAFASTAFQINASVINRYIEYGINPAFVREHVTYPQRMFEPAFDAYTAMNINLATEIK
ncbi:MAG: ATP-dependent Clp protease proteolytic subunit [Rhodospirillaceae bacterium]